MKDVFYSTHAHHNLRFQVDVFVIWNAASQLLSQQLNLCNYSSEEMYMKKQLGFAGLVVACVQIAFAGEDPNLARKSDSTKTEAGYAQPRDKDNKPVKMDDKTDAGSSKKGDKDKDKDKDNPVCWGKNEGNNVRVCR